MKGFVNKYSRGYLLPAAILLGLAVATISGTFLIYSVSSSESLNSQNYNAIAEEAARSGIAYADSCLTQNQPWSSGTLRPQTDCVGAGSSGSEFIAEHKHSAPGSIKEWQSRFEVTRNITTGIVTSTGFVELVNASGQKVKTFQKRLNMSMGEAYDTFPTSTGQSLTDIKNDSTDCAIANGSLYCWGANVNGQVGDDSNSGRNTPTRVGGALANKTVTKVSVSDSSVCAIADGRPYCWGANGSDQLGNDLDGNYWAKNDVWEPRENIPRTDAGPLVGPHTNPTDGLYVTDIGTASFNNPAGAIWVFAAAQQHSCALTADGAVSCWGYGGFRQLTGGGCIVWTLCARFSYPSRDNPTLVDGYGDNTGPFRGKKAVRVGASSHDSCLVANGTMYCWGVPAPLFAGPQIVCSLPLGLFSDAHATLVPFNVCIASYSNGYNVNEAPFSEMTGRFVDPATWDVSANEGCMMANRDFFCFGTTPAFGLFWTSSFRSPWKVISDSDVTSADNGDTPDLLTGGLNGLYCVVDRGVGKCAGSALNVNTGTGQLGDQGLRPVVATNLTGQVATSIAAGTHHGCMIANGRLYCWGDPSSGKLANNSFSTGSSIPIHTGTAGATPVGTGVGQYAAHNSVSSGEKHTCGIANGKVFCWGNNAEGQLGMGNDLTVNQPRSVPALVSKAATKVSAGKTHTCAIVEGQLYCWGGNAAGQLGNNSNTKSEVPVLINGFGALTTNMRVTDVSVNDNNTCAVANSRVFCWGSNSNKQVGDGTIGTNRLVPTLVTGGRAPSLDPLDDKAATAVSMGQTHACAIANADLYCWGNNVNGRTGKGSGANATGNSDPSQVILGAADQPRGPNNMTPSVSAVSAGSDFTCAIFNGKVGCWGSNVNGRTGQGPSATTGNTFNPTLINGTSGGYYATSLSAGREHACALIHGNNSKTSGNMFCWGNGGSGRLGYGSPEADRSSITTPITGGVDMREGPTNELRSATSISAGAETSCAIANAVILCWGKGSDGQFGTGPVPVATSNTPVKTTSYQVRSSAYVKGPIF